jgi:hypothetical protein
LCLGRSYSAEHKSHKQEEHDHFQIGHGPSSY